jgi:hypothetical protein
LGWEVVHEQEYTRQRPRARRPTNETPPLSQSRRPPQGVK